MQSRERKEQEKKKEKTRRGKNAKALHKHGRMLVNRGAMLSLDILWTASNCGADERSVVSFTCEKRQNAINAR